MNTDRINALIKKLVSKKIDGFLIKKKENIAYLLGYRGEDSVFCITPQKNFFITDSRYKEEAESEIKEAQIYIKKPGENFYKIIKHICKRNRIRRLGFESKNFSFSDYEGLKNFLKNTALFPISCLVEKAREVKTKEEIECIQNSCKIAVRAIEYAKKNLRPGLKEVQVATEIEHFIKTNGAKPPFPIIVASGSRSSQPHAVPSEKIIKSREIILIDLGALSYEYASDLTRVLFLGRIDKNLRRLYNAVLSAQKTVVEHIQPGASASLLDRIARQKLNKFSLGKYFIHSLGHGIGREVHELPFITHKSKEKLRPGMVFTIEPGIYIPRLGGVRIEDVVLVTENGCKVLTDEAPHIYVN